MSDNQIDCSAAPLHQWLAEPLEMQAASALERIRRADDVRHLAVMPDVHVAGEACVGVAMATSRLVYPQAVGGDIGCGMLAVAFNVSADVLSAPADAGRLLREIGRRIPARRHHRARMLEWPESLRISDLSHGSLQSIAKAEGQLQLGTLGGGNHFVEMQADEADRLWLMIHTGSRIIGQEVKGHHLARATLRSSQMQALDTDDDAGQAYLNDQEWARRFARENRLAISRQVADAMAELFAITTDESTLILCDHNHVCPETHFGQQMLVHRKGAMPAGAGEAGVVPGSMGTASMHVEGRGCAEALRSSAHGAGRKLSRTAARQMFSARDVERQLPNVWFDPRLAEALVEELPASYKDIRAVMRAQSELVRITRTLRPVMVYKGR
jgi:tRNA-splicing ligase RtcB